MSRRSAFQPIRTAFSSPFNPLRVRQNNWQRLMALILIVVTFFAPLNANAKPLSSGSQMLPTSVQFDNNSLIGFLLSGLSLFQKMGAEKSPGMPTPSSPQPALSAPQSPETKTDKEARVAQLTVSSGDTAQLFAQQPMNFTAIPLDKDGAIIQGLTTEWSSSDQETIAISKQGQAMAMKEGKAELIAKAGNAQTKVQVFVIAGTGEAFGGKKPDSKRYQQPQSGVSRTSNGAKFTKAIWSTTDQSAPAKLSARSLSSFVKPAKFMGATTSVAAATAMAVLRPINDDPLPDDESQSLYSASNRVGTPPGKVERGASMPAAATGGSELPGSSDFSFSVPVVNLPGRQIDVAMSLAYNSRVWHKSYDTLGDPHLTYDVDSGWPAAGFRLGYGQLEDQGSQGFTLTDADGTRHQLAPRTGVANTYDSTDGTFLTFVGGRSNGTITYPDSTLVDYGAAGTMTQNGQTVPGYRSYPVRITERSGNYLDISYQNGVGPQIASISDTLGRYVTFYYSGNDLVTIKVPGYNGGADRQTVRFYYQDLPLDTSSASFQIVTPHIPATTPRVIKYIYFPGTGSGFRYDYSSYGMIYQIKQLRGMTVSTTLDNQTGTVTNDGQTAATTTYNYPTSPSALSDAPTYTQRTDDWAGRTTAQASVYTFSVDQAQGISTITAPDTTVTENHMIVAPNQWNDGLLSETIIKQGTNVLAKTHIDWGNDGSNPGSPRNQRPTQILTTNETGQTRGTIFTYTSYNNVSVASERDFGATTGTLGAELRRTETTYETRSLYTSRNLIHLPTSVKVFAGGASTPLARVDYAYDTESLTQRAYDPFNEMPLYNFDSSYDPFAPVVTDCFQDRTCNCWRCGTFSHYNPATAYRGNLTKVMRYPDPANASTMITDTTTYDVVGNVVTMTVDCCQQKTFDYSYSYQYAYPTTQTRGAGTQANGELLTSSATYDYNTGLLRTSVDENNQTTTLDYYSQNLRPYRATRPDTGYTQYTFEDNLVDDPPAPANPALKHTYVLVSRSRGANPATLSWQFMDGRGAVARVFTQTDDATDTYITADIQYDSMGRVSRTSNPYYTPGGSLSAIKNPNDWTTNTYDGLGRAYQVTLPDGTMMQTSFQGTTITATDQAGKQRRTITDALGRVTELHEPDVNGNLGTVSAPNQKTSYLYDALNNLVKITQGSQNRYFKFDGLSRTTFDRQVEESAPYTQTDTLTGNSAWSHKWVYNTKSLVTDFYDARSLHSVMTYDGLNRIKTITYSGGQPALETPLVTYTYGTSAAAFNLGRLQQVTTAAASGTGYTIPQTTQAFTYDLMGRVTGNTQTVGSSGYTLSYAYDTTDQLTSETYPDGKVFTNVYDRALRLKSVADQGITYANNLTYAPHGGLLSEAWGNGNTYSIGYNQRLQANQIKLVQGTTEVQRYDYAFGQVTLTTGIVDTTKNNGQIGRMDKYTGGTKQGDERFAYDSLGRIDIASAYKADATTLNYRSDFDYDRYGNRFQKATGSQNFNIGYIPVETTDIDTATNRYSSNVTYDAAGNITADYKFRAQSYTYDANSRMRQTFDSDGNGRGTATYDAMGQRVQTTIGSEVRYFVYDVMGRVVAEYGPDGWERDRVYRGAGAMLATVEAIGNCRKTIEQFVQAMYWGALGRQPNTTENTTWVNNLRTAQGQGQSQLLAQAQTLAHTLFNSSEYTTRARTDREFIADLYWAYLQRAPEEDGYAFWLNDINTCRQTTGCNVITHETTAFDVSAEFAAVLQQLCTATPTTSVLWQMTDHTGSVRLLVDQNGVVQGRHEYLPFGDEIGGDFPRANGSMAQNGGVTQDSAIGTTTTGLDNWRNTIRARFAEMDKDAVTGLDHTPFRKYDSWQGRWTSPDPYSGSMSIGDPQSLNRYSYVGNDPVNFTDPTGLYEGCVHEAMTKFLAQLSGKYSDDVATTLGKFAGDGPGGADSSEYAATSPINALLGIISEGPSARIHFASNFRLRREEGRFDTYIAFGTDRGYQRAAFVLHSIQDVHGAHQGYSLPFGHFFAGHTPDRIIGDAKFMRAANETFQVLTGDKNVSLTGQQVNDLINAIVAGCGDKAKKLQITRPASTGSSGGGGGGDGRGSVNPIFYGGGSFGGWSSIDLLLFSVGGGGGHVEVVDAYVDYNRGR